MKTKLIALFLSIVLVVVLSACGAKAPAPTAVPADGGSESSEGGDATAAPAGDVVAKYDFNNSGAVDICELYLAPAGTGTDNWGPDQLQGQKIAAGGKFTLNNIPANTYDVRWVGCDKTEGVVQADIKNP